MTVEISDTFNDAVLAARNTAMAGGTFNFYSDAGRTTLLLAIALHASAPLTDEGTANTYQVNRDSGVFTGYQPSPTATGTAVAFDYKSSASAVLISGTVSDLAGAGDVKIPTVSFVTGTPLPAETWGSEPTIEFP